jgi:cytochrome oxidase Cu insertion factor (SCO1/SenC/PrrC family)
MVDQKKKTVLLRTMILCLVLLLGHSPALAQVGPKDGADLPATDLERVKVGQPAPDFTLEDMYGKKISLSDFRGKKSVVLVFYRGYW